MQLITPILFPASRRKLLGLLLLHPETHYHVREIARLTNTSAGSLHRELAKLAKAQVLIRETSGNQVYYQANTGCPIFEELASILRKTSGLVDVITEALTPLNEKIEVAFIFGSTGAGKENSGSDVDILIIGKLSYSEAVTTLYPAQAIISREINPKVYQRTEWQKLVNNNDAFVQEILNKPKLFIIGTMNDLE